MISNNGLSCMLFFESNFLLILSLEFKLKTIDINNNAISIYFLQKKKVFAIIKFYIYILVILNFS